ncbi:hypothetical protein CRE_08599 [Caenorhabditis remanei]|uniref:Uncharacterized protein n=1 Tax=Caenorhabditis remanei TaxID=31234 RepID=E3NJI7_CAERE|nr:hypothetical protein CRE_08599 [Caenorhabditis remanei]
MSSSHPSCVVCPPNSVCGLSADGELVCFIQKRVKDLIPYPLWVKLGAAALLIMLIICTVVVVKQYAIPAVFRLIGAIRGGHPQRTEGHVDTLPERHPNRMVREDATNVQPERALTNV